MLLSINRKQNIKGGLKYLRNIHLKDSEREIEKSQDYLNRLLYHSHFPKCKHSYELPTFYGKKGSVMVHIKNPNILLF
jgi:hypothetical protein